jgi:thioredoxin-like negative regulator of GroEL
MKSYREKRISEMMQIEKEKEEKNNRNEYIHVSHEEWTKEVTEVSLTHPVLVLLTKENSKACYPLERVMEDVAHKYRLSQTKFRRAEARDIIPNYPERNVPTLILYRNGDVVENIVGIEQFGGMNGVNTETVRRRVRMKSDEFLMDRGEEEAKEAEKRREKETAKNG